MPASGGPRLPAEWETQSAVMLTWPHADSDWADTLTDVEAVFNEIGAHISQHERLLSVCQSAAHVERVRQNLLHAGADCRRLLFANAPSNDTWARDHGPLTTVYDDGARLHDFSFNGWGNKFDATLDNAITGQLAHTGLFADSPCIPHAMVLEGGAIETDGAGTLLATRSSIITETRNGGWQQADVEAYLSEQLGFERYLWLDHGDISGDDTDGHIDTLARFADCDTILYATAPPGDPDHASLTAMAEELRSFRTCEGSAYRLIALPFAGEHRDDEGRRLPATYANFLIANGIVLLPVYGVEQDATAIEIIAKAYPGRRVIPIDCRPIIHQYGSLHCLTMQFPAQIRFNTVDETPAT